MGIYIELSTIDNSISVSELSHFAAAVQVAANYDNDVKIELTTTDLRCDIKKVK